MWRAHRVCLQHLLSAYPPDRLGGGAPGTGGGAALLQPGGQDAAGGDHPHAGTSAETVATTLAFARAQGKTPIVVKDEAGFYVNRILAPT